MNTRKLTGYLFLVYFLLMAHSSQALEMNGAASFHDLGGEIYLGALYLDARSTDINAIFAANSEKKMELRFSQSMSKRRWAGNWMQSIAINNDRDSLLSAAGELSEILSAFADNLNPGDRVEFHYRPASGTAIIINGTTLAEGKSAQIFNLFLSAWIGSVPPSSRFKNALLGTENSTAEQERFAAIQPTEQRIAAVKAWGAPKEEVVEGVVEDIPVQARPEPEPATAKPEPPVVVATTAEKPESAPAPTPEPALASTVSTAVDENETELDLSVESILAQQEYTADLIHKIYREVKYPAAAVQRNYQGSVRVSLVVTRDGSVDNIVITEETKYTALNREALRAIKSASPFSSLPATIRDDSLEIVVPITFKLAQ